MARKKGETGKLIEALSPLNMNKKTEKFIRDILGKEHYRTIFDIWKYDFEKQIVILENMVLLKELGYGPTDILKIAKTGLTDEFLPRWRDIITELKIKGERYTTLYKRSKDDLNIKDLRAFSLVDDCLEELLCTKLNYPKTAKDTLNGNLSALSELERIDDSNSHKDIDDYAKKALQYYHLEEYEVCSKYVTKVLAEDEKHSYGNYVQALLYLKKYEQKAFRSVQQKSLAEDVESQCTYEVMNSMADDYYDNAIEDKRKGVQCFFNAYSTWDNFSKNYGGEKFTYYTDSKNRDRIIIILIDYLSTLDKNDSLIENNMDVVEQLLSEMEVRYEWLSYEFEFKEESILTSFKLIHILNRFNNQHVKKITNYFLEQLVEIGSSYIFKLLNIHSPYIFKLIPDVVTEKALEEYLDKLYKTIMQRNMDDFQQSLQSLDDNRMKKAYKEKDFNTVFKNLHKRIMFWKDSDDARTYGELPIYPFKLYQLTEITCLSIEEGINSSQEKIEIINNLLRLQPDIISFFLDKKPYECISKIDDGFGGALMPLHYSDLFGFYDDTQDSKETQFYNIIFNFYKDIRVKTKSDIIETFINEAIK